MNRDASNGPNDKTGSKCNCCGYDFHKSWSAYCFNCDKTFHVDCETSKAICSDCGKPSDKVIKDEPMEICKHCLNVALLELNIESDKEEHGQAVGTSSPPAGTKAHISMLSSAAQDGMEGQHGDSSLNYLDELWRFMGCVCGNHEPDCFELQACEWTNKSYYCLDCCQPYSAFLWDTELRGDQCPRCNGSRMITDTIKIGSDVIMCQKCESKVSKDRFDTLSQEVQKQSEEEKLGPNNDRGTDQCPHCRCTEVNIFIVEYEENPCVMRICDRCCSADFLAVWNRQSDKISLSDKISEKEDSKRKDCEERSQKALSGLKELALCCGDPASLHPVEDDIDDNKLECSRCQKVINLRDCNDSSMPATVSELRRTLKGKFSSGKMGRPYQTVKVSQLDELKPADQLDFKKALYSHHAIVAEPLPESKKVEVIEYTGTLNRRSISAVLRFLPSKACVKRSLLKFGNTKQIMHRVDYYSLDCFQPRVVLKRAAARIGEANYHLISSNCEHFSNWAKANVSFSRQVEKFKKKAKSVLRSAVVEISEYMDDLPTQGSVGSAVTILQDIRAEMLRVLDPQNNSSSIRNFWMPIRLVLKWIIRGIPLVLFRFLPKKIAGQFICNVDKLLAPISRLLDKMIPIEDSKDDKADKDMDPAENPKQNVKAANKCQSCGYDFDKSWSAYCDHCDKTFHVDCETSKVPCLGCGKPSDKVFKDESMEICKHCLSAALPDLSD